MVRHEYNDAIIIDRDTTLHQRDGYGDSVYVFAKWDTAGTLQWVKQPGLSHVRPYIPDSAGYVFPLYFGADETGTLLIAYGYMLPGYENIPAKRPYIAVWLNENLEPLNGSVLDISRQSFYRSDVKIAYYNKEFYMANRFEPYGNDTVVIAGNDTLVYNPQWGGRYMDGFGWVRNSFTVLSSFNVDGSARWAKVLLKNSLPMGNLLADSLGNVFAAGYTIGYHPPVINPERPCIGIIDNDTLFIKWLHLM